MSSANHQDVTMLLREASAGAADAPGRLLELVYEDLRRLASAYMKNERSDHTLQATALVHEAYIRLVDWENVTWQNRAQFFAVAAEVMRKILIDHARKRGASKRGAPKFELDEAVGYADEKEFDILAMEEVLQSLERLDRRKAKIVELRFFGGLSIEETAHVLDVSITTVKREWTFARAWLQRELKRT